MAPAPEPELSAWETQKLANRLAKQVEKVESGRWLPRTPVRLSGRAAQTLREARDMLHEAGNITTKRRA